MGTSSPDRFYVYKALLRCTECGGSIVIQGPSTRVTCPDCDTVIEMPAVYFKSLMETAFGTALGDTNGGLYISTTLGGAQTQRTWSCVAGPSCSECGVPLRLHDIPPDHTGDIFCTACGKPTSSYPAPAWLRSVLPSAKHVYGAPPEEAGGAPQPNETKPICFQCPRCGAALDIDAAAPRVFHCRHCDTDLFLPQALWRALHPVKKRTAWVVRFG